jgi:hypothetical protein
MKKIGYLLSFLLIGILMPVAIWVAAFVALYQNRKSERHVEEPALQIR